MAAKKQHSFFTFFLILVLCVNLLNVQVVRAEGEPQTEPPPTQVATEPPTEEPTEIPTEVPTEAPTEAPTELATELPTEVPVEATPTVVEMTATVPAATSTPVQSTATPTSISQVMTQIPATTAVVVINEEGTQVPLASEEAIEITQSFDPMWCPAGVLPGGPGCTTNFGSIAELITELINNTNLYAQNGVIYFVATTGVQTTGASLNLTTTGLNPGDFDTLNDFSLTLQGGWNGQNGNSATFTGTTNFGTNSINVGTAGNPWVGNITLTNFSFGSGTVSQVNVYTTSGDITLSNVDVTNHQGGTNTAILNSTSGDITVQSGSTFDGDGNNSNGFAATTGSGTITISDTTFSDIARNGVGTYDGANLSAPTVTLNNVTASGNEGNGIAITNTNFVNLINVTSGPNVNNTGNGLSGVLVSGTGSKIVSVAGGVFADNGRYGIEVIGGSIFLRSTPTCPTSGGTRNGLGCYTPSPTTDATAPVISASVSGTGGANGWYTSDVTVIWSVSDPQSGILSSSGCSTTTLTAETTGNTLTCSATNGANLSNSASVTIKIDKSAPTASLAIIGGALGANDWYTSNVTVQTTGADSISGVSCTANQVVSTDTTGTVVNGSCTNGAGLVTNASPITVKLDKTAPTATLTISAGTGGANGWYTSDVTIQTAGSDSISGPVTCTADQFQTVETTGTTFNGSCTNAAGLTGNASPLVIKLDKTNPTITFTGRTAANGAGWNNTDVTVNWSCKDSVSGSASDTVSQTLTSEGVGLSTTGTCSDLAGNTASDTQGGINIDKTAPSLSLPSDITAEASSSAGALVTYSATVTDNLDDGVTISCAPASGAVFPIGSTTVSCSSTDAAGNTANGSFQIQVGDTSGPVIEAHADVTAEATSSAGAVVTYSNPAASDAVDGSVAVTCAPASGETFPLGDTLVTCNASDSRGNKAAPSSFTIHVVDTTAPVIAAHADVTAEATSPLGAVVTYTSPATSDVVDGAGTATCSPASGEAFALGSTTVTCNASDAHGNAAKPTTFLVHVVDTLAPVIAAHADITVEATSADGAVVSYASPATSDAVDGAGTATCSPASDTTFPLGDTTVACSATDSSGNTARPTSFIVHVVDTTAPVIAFHADMTVQATSSSGAVVNYSSPSTTDAVDGAGTATCLPASGIAYPMGDTTVTCNATDAHGNAAQPTSFVIHVVDTAGPIIAAHADVTVEATSASGAVVTYSNPTAADAVDGPVAVTCAPASGTTFSLGDTTVTCSASDSRGNAAATGTFVVHVVDTTAPIIDFHADITVEASSASGATVNYKNPPATDSVDGLVEVTCSPASGSTFPLGSTTVTCDAADSRGNQAEPTTFTVHVVDTIAPVIIKHADVTVEAASLDSTVVNYSAPTVVEAVDANVKVTCSPASGSQFAFGDTTVICNATDASGNAAEPMSFVVHVVDTTAPVIAFHADVTVQATSADGALVNYTLPTATDAVDQAVNVTCSPASGTQFNRGDTLVTCNASDKFGNQAEATSFTVHVLDTNGPVIAAHDDVTVQATGPDGANVNYDLPSTFDAVDGTGTATCSPEPNTQFPLGDTTVTCSATDSNENVATPTTFTVHVVDTTAPLIANVDDITVEATGPNGAVATYTTPTASDIVDGTVDVTCSPESGGQFPLGDTTVTCGATDKHNNAATKTFVVHVVDTTAPVIANASDVVVEATSPSGAVATYTTPSAFDIVDGAVAVTCTPASGTTFPVGATQVTCNAMDTHKRVATPETFYVFVEDTTAPVLHLPANITVNATGPNGAVVNFSVTASDTVDTSVMVECNSTSGSTFPLGITEVTCVAMDRHENQTEGSFFINVMDPEGPILSLPANIVVEATSASGAKVNYTATATDLVDGNVPVTCTPASGGTFALGTTTVTCQASDSGKHTNSGSFSILVQDTTAPAIAPHSDFTTETDSLSGVTVTYVSPATTDIVDGAGIASCTPASGSIFPVGDTIVTCTATDAHGNSAKSTFTVHVKLNTPVIPTEETSSTITSTVSSLIIPLTGEAIDLDCNTVLWAFGIKLSFYNLCDYQATLNSVGVSDLPTELPEGFSFVMGLDVDILSTGQSVEELPENTGVEMDFPIYQQSLEEFAVLVWSEEDGKWIEVSEQLDSEKISETLQITEGDELYQVLTESLSEVFYQTLTTQKTGIFILVKK